MKSILKQSFTIVIAAALIIAVYFIAGVLIFANKMYDDTNTRNLEEAARALKNFTPVEVFTDTTAAEEWASHFGNSRTADFYRITLISRNGRVIFDTAADSLEMEDHLDRQEFQAAVRTGIGISSRPSATLGQFYRYIAIAFENPAGEFAGVLRLSQLDDGFFSRLLSSALPFLLGGLLIIVGVCAGLYYFSRRLSRSAEAKLDAELVMTAAELRAKSEEAEMESRHREVILNSMIEGIITLDNHLKIVLANSRLCSLFGFEKAENVRGMSLIEFSRSAELEKAAKQVLSTNQPCELVLKRYISGSEQHFKVYAAPLESSTEAKSLAPAMYGSPPEPGRGVVIALGDISRLVKLEQVRKDFAANVSHELRTPIQVVKGFAETILDSPMDDKEEMRRFVEFIRKNAQTMENLTNDLLTIVSLEDENSHRPPMETTVLENLINEAIDIVKIAAGKKDISFDVSCPPDLSAKLYSSFIIQALVNLLDNGIKYSDPGSRIKVKAFEQKNCLVIEVKDKGIGIPTEHLDRIFERFYRVDRARSRAEGGTGLGLSIVRHIALLHGGTVEAKSHAGEGSTFRLTLPIKE